MYFIEVNITELSVGGRLDKKNKDQTSLHADMQADMCGRSLH